MKQLRNAKMEAQKKHPPHLVLDEELNDILTERALKEGRKKGRLGNDLIRSAMRRRGWLAEDAATESVDTPEHTSASVQETA